jgi:flagellar biosynthetic protein FliQ
VLAGFPTRLRGASRLAAISPLLWANIRHARGNASKLVGRDTSGQPFVYLPSPNVRHTMNPQAVITLGQQALYVMLMIAAPMLLAALVVGLAVSILQAATQINEMTLSFIPKLVAMLAALVIAGPWMVTFFVDYMRRLFESIPLVIG